MVDTIPQVGRLEQHERTKLAKNNQVDMHPSVSALACGCDTSSSYLVFPTVMDCGSELKSETNPFSLKAAWSGCTIRTTERKLRQYRNLTYGL